MANRDDGQNFPTTGRPPDGNWMDSGHIRPSWMEKEARNTADSGIESMETRYGSLPPQPGGRKHHADDGTLWRMYADIPSTNSGTLSVRIGTHEERVQGSFCRHVPDM